MALQFEPEVIKAPTGDKKAGGLNLTLPTGHKRAGAAERMFFTEQLALLLETGESLYGALTTIVKQTENAEMCEAVTLIAQNVSEGRSFANALAEHKAIFPPTYVNLVAASEAGGFMHEVLEQLLKMDEKREQMRTTLVSAATYPLFLIAFSLAVVVFVLVVVFPKFGDMFLSIQDQLPMSTKVLMSTSDVMRQYWIVLLAGLGIFIVAVRHWLRSEAGSARIDYMKLHTPGIRDVFTQIYLVQSLQVLSLSLNNGVSVMESLAACRDVVQNSLFRRLIAKVEESVQAGAGVAAGLADSKFLPDLAKHMIATGEQTGNLGKVAGRICDYYEVQLAKKLDALSKLAEPIMLLVMGVVVGVLVSSLILPIFKLSRAVS
ncbi:MAG: type II secretion system F family protein [Gammaproteobacteria bacterium]|nr:type II secretion system F family protein [Woeseia sp.]MBU2677801.1 type II secretion system F family protein [Gammaproteobacteria bacterium]NNL51534.1 type II secretion system F family protein [Woeseiaceae bacterium]